MSADNLLDFFKRIWKDTEGLVYLPEKDENHHFKKWFFKWPEHAPHIVRHVLQKTAEGREVYYSPALWKQSAVENKSAAKEHVLGSHVLWVDFDGNAPGSWEAGSPDRPAATVSAPSVRVQSSTVDRQHAYWVLDHLETDTSVIENRNRSLAFECSADTSGWDVTQVLRPPYTTNYGYGKEDRQGKSYPVRIEEETDVTYTIDDFKEVADFRPMVQDSLADKEIPDIRQVLALGKWTQKFYELFDTKKEDIPDKKRSDYLMSLAYSAAENSMTDEQMYAVVFDADTRWEKYVHRSDRVRRLVDIVERARRKHPYGLDNFTFAGLVGGDTPVETAKKAVYSYAEFMALDIHIEWFLKGLLPVRGHGYLVGPPGIGKTQLGIRMAQAIALGNNFMAWENEMGPKKVLFFSLEMSDVTTKYFLEVMSPSHTEEEKAVFGENFHITCSGSLPIDRPEGKQFFESLIQEIKPDFILIDSLGKLTLTDISKPEVREVLIYLHQIREQYGVSTCVVHHNRKASERNKNPSELDDLYGNVYISADADYVLTMTKVDEAIQITSSKTRLGKQQAPFLVQRTEYLDFEHVGEIDELNPMAKKGTVDGLSGDTTKFFGSLLSGEGPRG